MSDGTSSFKRNVSLLFSVQPLYVMISDDMCFHLSLIRSRNTDKDLKKNNSSAIKQMLNEIRQEQMDNSTCNKTANT